MSEDYSDEDLVQNFVADLERFQNANARLSKLIPLTLSGDIRAAEELIGIIRHGKADIDSALLDESITAYKYYDLNYNLALHCDEIYRRYAAFLSLGQLDDIPQAKAAYQDFVNIWHRLTDANQSHFIARMKLKIHPNVALDQFVDRTYKM